MAIQSLNFTVFPPRDVLDKILDLIESVSEGFPTYSFMDYSIMKISTNNFYRDKISSSYQGCQLGQSFIFGFKYNGYNLLRFNLFYHTVIQHFKMI